MSAFHSGRPRWRRRVLLLAAAAGLLPVVNTTPASATHSAGTFTIPRETPGVHTHEGFPYQNPPPCAHYFNHDYEARAQARNGPVLVAGHAFEQAAASIEMTHPPGGDAAYDAGPDGTFPFRVAAGCELADKPGYQVKGWQTTIAGANAQTGETFECLTPPSGNPSGFAYFSRFKKNIVFNSFSATCTVFGADGVVEAVDPGVTIRYDLEYPTLATGQEGCVTPIAPPSCVSFGTIKLGA